MSSNSTNIINPKPCSYNCGTRIYWDTSSKSYMEVYTKQKHLCKNRTKSASSPSYSNKPNYYNKFSKQPKPKMSNSLELITGSFDSVQNKYEISSDIVTEYNGKIHGSQSQINSNNISLMIYFEVPEGKREEIKEKFNTITKSNQQVVLQNNYKINNQSS